MSKPHGYERALLGALSFAVLVASPLQSCKRKAVPRDSEAKPHESVTEEFKPAAKADEVSRPRIVNAAWYEVPLVSLAKRRAGVSELTAAHNKLPIGTMVRVTRLSNGKSVNVRITDRGIHKRGVKLDLCKEAAEELDMIEAGIARVRLQILPENDGSAPPEPSSSPES
jgi:rare lipoprotein A (peptidoglycan hydrolase)